MSAVTDVPNAIPHFRIVLFVDAATCLAMGLVLVLAAGNLGALLGLPAPLLQYAGLILLPTAAFIAWVASRRYPPSWGVFLVISGNVLWVAASLALLVMGWVSPTWAGKGFIVGQAFGVAVLTAIEYVLANRP